MKTTACRSALATALTTLLVCAAAVRPASAQGVIDPLPSNYHLSPEKVPADKAFQLQTLNPDFSCALKYLGQTVQVNGNRIDLTFRDSVLLGVGTCVIGEFGPTFDIPALKEGSYQVYVSQLINCPKGLMCLPVIIPEYAGTLAVGATAGLASFRPAQRGFAADFTADGNLELTLPGATDGTWKVDILATTGRRMQSFSGRGRGGETLRLPLGSMARGLYWVRLEYAGSETLAPLIAPRS